jgi:hypothetical protein
MAVREHNKLEDNCPDGECPAPYHDEMSAFRDFRTASTVGYVIGAVGLAAGAVLLLTVPGDSPDRSSAAVGVQLTPTSAAMVGAF